MFVRWICTQWCNYACKYCRQDHSRNSKYRGNASHWVDNASVSTWIDAFAEHFSGAHLAITGGEPMLDRKHMDELLCNVDFSRMRMDTNGTSDPSKWKCDKSKVVLMMSYHPSEVSEDKFLDQLKRHLDCGWNVAMVTLVVLPDRFDMLKRMTSKTKPLGVPINANVYDGNLRHYTPEQVELLKAAVPSDDWYFRTGGTTLGMQCTYPAAAYEMYPDGSLEVACHPHLSGSVFGSLPTLFEGSASCPKMRCTCLDKYSHLKDLGLNAGATPLESYAGRIPLL